MIREYERSIGRNQYTTVGAMSGLADAYRKSRNWEKAGEHAEIIKRQATRSTGEAQYTRAKEAYKKLTSGSQTLVPSMT